MALWLQIVIGFAATLTALSTIWRIFIKPVSELITLQQAALPMLRELTRTFGGTPAPFEVLADIVKEFRANAGSTLRDAIDRLEAAASKNSFDSEVLKVQVEATRMLAIQDREQLSRLLLHLDRLTVKVDTGDIERGKILSGNDRIEAAAAVVASDLAESYERADAVPPGKIPGEAADAASRSNPTEP